MAELSEVRWLRLKQIIGQREVTEDEARKNRKRVEKAKKTGGKLPNAPRRPRPAIPPLIPVSKSTWWQGIADDRFPKPEYPFGPDIPCWRSDQIRALLEKRA